MKNYYFIIVLCFICLSCNEKIKSTDKYKIVFKDVAAFNSFDFESLNKDLDSEVLFKTYNLKKSQVELPFGNFSIFLSDINNNNSFIDKGIDVLMISEYDRDNPRVFHIANTLSNKGTLFSINDQAFIIKDIFENEGFYEGIIEISELPVDSISEHNRFFDKIPSIDFFTVENKERLNFLDFKNDGKMLFIEFWTTWCSPCIQSLPTMKTINDNFSDEITLISINSDSKHLSKVNDFILENEMSWIQGFDNEEIKKRMGFNIFPRGYLFDSNGDLLKFDTSPYEVLNFLKKNQKPN